MPSDNNDKSLFTTFLDKPPAACIRLPLHHFNYVYPNHQAQRHSDSIFLIGTYELHQDRNGQRTGSLVVMQLVNGEVHDVQNVKLEERYGAVLDLRCCALGELLGTSGLGDDGSEDAYISGIGVVTVATSTGYLLFYTYQYTENGKFENLSFLSAHLITSPENGADEEDDETEQQDDKKKSILVLSIAHNLVDKRILSCTFSNSEVVVLHVSLHKKQTDTQETTEALYAVAITELARLENVHAGLEVWTSHFSLDGEMLYTGGDDGSFITHSITKTIDDGDKNDDLSPSDKDNVELEAKASMNYEPTLEITTKLRNRKMHDAGVTAILQLSDKWLLTGSYDNHIRVYNVVKRRNVDGGEVDLGGGVWRLEVLDGDELWNKAKALNETSEDGQGKVWVLASCMHAGCRVLEIDFGDVDGDGGEIKVEVVGKMEEHESMNYASAAVEINGQVENEEGRRFRIVSTSFYDKRVVVWDVDVGDNCVKESS